MSDLPVDLPFAADRWALDSLFDAVFAAAEGNEWASTDECFRFALPLMMVMPVPRIYARVFAGRVGTELERSVLPWLSGEEEREDDDDDVQAHSPCTDDAEGGQGTASAANSGIDAVGKEQTAVKTCRGVGSTTPRPQKRKRTEIGGDKDPAIESVSAPTEAEREEECRRRTEALWNCLHQQQVLSEIITAVMQNADVSAAAASFLLHGIMTVLREKLTASQKVDLLARIPWQRSSAGNALQTKAAEEWPGSDWKLIAQAQARWSELQQYGREKVNAFFDWSDFSADIHELTDEGVRRREREVALDDKGNKLQVVVATSEVVGGEFRDLVACINGVEEVSQGKATREVVGEEEVVKDKDRQRFGVSISLDFIDSCCGCEGEQPVRISPSYRHRQHAPWLKLTDVNCVLVVMTANQVKNWCGRHQPWCGLRFRISVRLKENDSEEKLKPIDEDSKWRSGRGMCRCGECMKTCMTISSATRSGTEGEAGSNSQLLMSDAFNLVRYFDGYEEGDSQLSDEDGSSMDEDEEVFGEVDEEVMFGEEDDNTSDDEFFEAFAAHMMGAGVANMHGH